MIQLEITETRFWHSGEILNVCVCVYDELTAQVFFDS